MRSLENWRNNLRSYLDQTYGSKRELARAIGVSDAQLHHWISGVRNPNVTHIIDISNHLRISVEDLLSQPNEHFCEMHGISELQKES